MISAHGNKLGRKKEDLDNMFPPITKEWLMNQIAEIKAADHLTEDEKINHLEGLKTQVIISNNPKEYFRGLRKFVKSIS